MELLINGIVVGCLGIFVFSLQEFVEIYMETYKEDEDE